MKFKVLNKYWYYVDMSDPLKPKVLRDRYEFKSETKNCMDKYLHHKKRYFLVKGKFLKLYRDDLELIKPPYSQNLILDWTRVPIVNSEKKKQRLGLNIRRLRFKKAKEEGIYKNHLKNDSYEYPDDCITWRQKKTFRELERRKKWKNLKVIY